MKSQIKYITMAAFAISSINMGLSVPLNAAQINPYPSPEDCPDFFQRNCSDGRYLKLHPTSNLHRLCSYCELFAPDFNNL
jgi:hypothetical protein